MSFPRRPSSDTIDRFLEASRDAPLSYGSSGIIDVPSVPGTRDQAAVVIGRGAGDFARARAALMAWRHFNLGWVEVFPRRAPVAPGTVVALLIRHLGFWSLNGCRVVSRVGSPSDQARCGYAYGTLTNHAESGEEAFAVVLDPQTDEVSYCIRAISWPQARLARIGQPYVRILQARFREHSADAMRRAIGAATVRRS